MSVQPHIVFYDDSCPLCDTEITHYKKMQALHEIKWLGIHSHWDDIKHYGLSKETLLRRIHAVHSDGTIVSGAAVFVLIWSSLQSYQRLAWLVSKLHLLRVMDFFYKYFAAWRYRKNPHCQIEQ